MRKCWIGNKANEILLRNCKDFEDADPDIWYSANDVTTQKCKSTLFRIGEWDVQYSRICKELDQLKPKKKEVE